VTGGFLHFALVVIRFIPAFIFFPVVRFGLRVFYCFNRAAQRNAWLSLTAAFGDGISGQEKRRLARRSFLNLSEGLAAFVFMSSRPDTSRAIFEFEGLERLKAAVSPGKGAVIGIAHFGPFVTMLLRFISEGFQVSVVARTPRGTVLKEKFRQSSRYVKGMDVILSTPLRQCILTSIGALGSGRLLVMPVDQNYGAAGRVFVPFFGHPAATAPGPVIVAQRTGSAFFMAFAVPSGSGKFRIVIEGPLECARTGDERRDLTVNTGMFTALVEQYVRRYPEQWSWLHRRWKCVPKDNERV
jgi:KDO2-lipid IV(A) lauroyltransferase